MIDHRNDRIFQAKVAGTRSTIQQLSTDGINDAHALIAREQGTHNLSGHFASILPLAVLFSQYSPTLLTHIKNLTDIDHNMGTGSSEARSQEIWEPVQAEVSNFKTVHGDDILTNTSQTVNDVLHTYLSSKYSGGQTTGGAGDTVFKRTLKLLGHIFY
ncbi:MULTISPECIES: hypothetical protein [Bacillus cereus group]|uniref:Uncharacterized protein n=1 Tax=Bacillus paranthracis TaxID=2026186 RepID=A0A9X8SLT6_9BACI|nr:MULTISPECIES: hypothetical protein [Bacillus cereus group]MCH5438468.1 hypothetical protein [Bacillus paranthracis]MDA1986265.1 hypothetical protein [Bacillus cereus group sp. BcHK104]SME36471.1 hypothetical protein BACERE00221_04221 [Bacillus paranthracis]